MRLLEQKKKWMKLIRFSFSLHLMEFKEKNREQKLNFDDDFVSQLNVYLFVRVTNIFHTHIKDGLLQFDHQIYQNHHPIEL